MGGEGKSVGQLGTKNATASRGIPTHEESHLPPAGRRDTGTIKFAEGGQYFLRGPERRKGSSRCWHSGEEKWQPRRKHQSPSKISRIRPLHGAKRLKEGHLKGETLLVGWGRLPENHTFGRPAWGGKVRLSLWERIIHSKTGSFLHRPSNLARRPYMQKERAAKILRKSSGSLPYNLTFQEEGES